MKAKIDLNLTREHIEHLSKLIAEHPNAPSVTVGCTVSISEIKFVDSYTELVCGSAIESTTAILRCK